MSFIAIALLGQTLCRELAGLSSRATALGVGMVSFVCKVVVIHYNWFSKCIIGLNNIAYPFDLENVNISMRLQDNALLSALWDVSVSLPGI